LSHLFLTVRFPSYPIRDDLPFSEWLLDPSGCGLSLTCTSCGLLDFTLQPFRPLNVDQTDNAMPPVIPLLTAQKLAIRDHCARICTARRLILPKPDTLKSWRGAALGSSCVRQNNERRSGHFESRISPIKKYERIVNG
jgi:hypothetical protein